MSAENVEIVRAYFQDLGRDLDSHWEDPDTPFGFAETVDAETPEQQAQRERTHPEVVWRPSFSPEQEFHGYAGLNRAIAEWLEVVDGWRITVEDVIDAGADRVIVTLRVYAHGKSSGADASQFLYSVCAIRDGQIILIEDHTIESEAREAAGLSE